MQGKQIDIIQSIMLGNHNVILQVFNMKIDEDSKKAIRHLAVISSLGLAMGISIAIGALLGYYLDNRFGTRPWCLIICLGLGIAAAFRNLYLLYKRAKDM